LSDQNVPTPKYTAIVASAGGLEAITALIQNLPSDTGISFIIAQHMSPKHKSLLGELLSRETPLAVHEIENGMVAEPNSMSPVQHHLNQEQPQQHRAIACFRRWLSIMAKPL